MSFTDRLDKVREALQREECDALVSFSPSANAYLTGFFGSTSAVIVTETEARFLCDFRYTEQAEKQVQGYTVSEEKGGLETRAAEYLNQFNAQRIALDSTAHTVHQYETLSKPLEGTLVSAPTLLSGLRIVKDAGEIEALCAATNLAEGVLADLLPQLEPGLLEREFAAQFVYEFKKRGASGPSFDPMALFGAHSSLPHGMPGDTPLEEGHIVLLDFGCVLDGYCSDLTRTFAFGRIPAEWFKEIYTVTLEAQLAALEVVKPGVACSEVDAVARDIIRDAGYGEYFGHGLGHGVGLEVHEAPRLNMQSKAILEPGMAVTIEPGIYLPGKGGVRIEDLVIVTEDGCDILTQTPKDLKVLA